ncbi:VCBS repeat-containing protein [Streptomyces sp. Z26]|uniref:FG-GAP repeat domain-containing protein n=1 Tax=Streptomyces sp. Z26 TaxID=2500177 RepID=UPI000EF15812|nr:VCBS repeat-containing protein [Streptomyces sp. Z26]RLL67781.1 VCBS repeat-containing protein [Streptomyces sp. Z26]
MLRTRTRLIVAPVAAAAVALTLAAYQAGATEPTDGSSHSGAVGAAPCLSGLDVLIGDLDGDSYPDRIGNRGLDGTKTTVEWGNADGSFGDKQEINDLVGAGNDETATAAVADFQNDGVLDLVVNIVEPSGGDDPSTARLSEYRPGPLKRADLSSGETQKLDIDKHGEVRTLGIARYDEPVGNPDDFPDLVMVNYAGDGVLERSVRLSQADGTPGAFSREADDKYGDWGTPAEPPSMPNDGWKQFYEPCS